MWACSDGHRGRRLRRVVGRVIWGSVSWCLPRHRCIRVRYLRHIDDFEETTSVHGLCRRAELRRVGPHSSTNKYVSYASTKTLWRNYCSQLCRLLHWQSAALALPRRENPNLNHHIHHHHQPRRPRLTTQTFQHASSSLLFAVCSEMFYRLTGFQETSGRALRIYRMESVKSYESTRRTS